MEEKELSLATMRFRDPKGVVGTLEIGAALALVLAAGDVALALDEHGVISDVAVSTDDMPDLTSWIGQPWIDTVAPDSKLKVGEMLSKATPHKIDRWRQVNQLGPDGNLPINYRLVDLGEGHLRMAIGRDNRPIADLQQRLLQTQQSLERDYLKLRQTEARYRLLFDIMSDPILVIDADTRRVIEANPASYHLFGSKPKMLEGKDLASLMDGLSRDGVTAFLGAAAATSDAAVIDIDIGNSDTKMAMSAIPFRQDGKRRFIIRIAPRSSAEPMQRSLAPMTEVIEQMPDAFVLANKDMEIISSNAAFVDLVHGLSRDQLVGEPLGRFIGRPGIDLELIRKQLDEFGQMRNATTIVHADDLIEESVEISAVKSNTNGEFYGFSIRTVGRRVREAQAGDRDQPRSVDQLTELVGRMPLKEIVRESTDLIERMCIEAALVYTGDNRASAAEILGLSRQSLYSKLHRHGLGNLTDRRDDA